MLQKKFKIYLCSLLALTFLTQNIELAAQTPLHFNITNDENEGVAFAIIYAPEIEIYTTTDFEGYAVLYMDEEVLSDSIEVIVSHVFHETRSLNLTLSELNEKPIDLSLKKKVVNVAEAIVTGRLNPIHQDSTIRSVRVLDRSIIEGRSATTGRDLFRNELNIKSSEDAILGSGISMGGLGGENIKVLIDGVPVIGRLNGGIDLSQIDLSNIDRVEIIEGPMSVEYGTDALAGTINFISNDKPYDQFNLSIGNKYESTGQHSQTVNNYIKNSSGKIAINASRLYFDGWSPGDQRIDWINDYYADSGRVHLWKPKLQYTFGIKGWHSINNWTIIPSLGVFNEKLINKGYPRAPYGEIAFDENYLTRRYNSSITFNHYNSSLKDLEILFSLNTFRRYKYRYSSDLTTLNSQLISGGGESDTTSLYELKSRGNRLVKHNERLVLNIGWDVSHEALSGERISNDAVPITDVAAFSIAKIKKHNNSIQLGIRKAWNSSFRSPLTPSIHGLVIHEKNTFRFSYAKGFRSPSLKEMHLEFVDSNHNLLGNADLTPETSHNIQAGLTRTNKNHTITVQTSWNSLDNMIMLIQSSEELSYTYENIGTFESVGIKSNYASSWGKLNWDIGVRWNAVQTNDLKIYTTEMALDLRWNFNNSRTQAHLSSKFNGKESLYFLNNEDVLEIGETAAYTFMDITLSHKNRKGNVSSSIGARNLFDIQNISTTGVGNTTNSQTHTSSNGLNLMSWGRSIAINIAWKFNK
jgi:outer membrane receptor for ferrienterochelin and colicins